MRSWAWLTGPRGTKRQQGTQTSTGHGQPERDTARGGTDDLLDARAMVRRRAERGQKHAPRY